MHPNGQLPAYEWNFGDVNPPVHAWAAWRVFQIDRKQHRTSRLRRHRVSGAGLSQAAAELHLVGQSQGRAGPQSSFRAASSASTTSACSTAASRCPTGGFIDQADGTSWMAMYCLNLMRIALELALHNPVYEDIATKFFEHFLLHRRGDDQHRWPTRGHRPVGRRGRVLLRRAHLPDGSMTPLKVRSMVGLIPLFAVETIEPETTGRSARVSPSGCDGSSSIGPNWRGLVSRWEEPGGGERRLLSLLRGHRMKRLLRADARRDGVPLRLRRARPLAAITASIRMVSIATARPCVVDYEPAESTLRPVRRQFATGAARSGFRSTT